MHVPLAGALKWALLCSGHGAENGPTPARNICPCPLLRVACIEKGYPPGSTILVVLTLRGVRASTPLSLVPSMPTRIASEPSFAGRLWISSGSSLQSQGGHDSAGGT